MFFDVLKDATLDSIRLLPFLFFAFFILELLDRSSGTLNQKLLAHFQKSGPFIGALLGCIPECGIPVLAANLFVGSFITPGTLLAIFLSTSDEAIFILLGTHVSSSVISHLVFTKLILSILCGYIMDFFFAKYFVITQTTPSHSHQTGCTHHSHNLLIHTLQHTLSLFCYVFLFTLGLNLLLEMIGFSNLASMLLKGSFFQPVLTALIGLIPSCAASILLTKLYTQGILSFASFLAGLCSTTGVGLAILAKLHPEKRKLLRFILVLLGCSTLIGMCSLYSF